MPARNGIPTASIVVGDLAVGERMVISTLEMLLILKY